ncbi:MAG: hypothetical protein NT002_09515 [candidate division Zixibacteria bacterium]|jgi:hypothetical protein|nr:hypothetical protein [candidate division Zixibacteria bacterium]
MRLKKSALLMVALLVLVSANLMAQTADTYGAVDTVYAEPYKIDAKHWGINISMFNDEEIIAISVPVTFSAGNNRLVADSTIFTGGRAEAFRVKFARPDTTTQCLTIGLIADIGVSVPPIPPGKGRIATIFVSSLDGKEITSFKVDSTTTPPGNSLQLVKQPSDGIYPAFVVKKAVEKEAAKEAEKKEKK